MPDTEVQPPPQTITVVNAGNVANLAGFKEGDDWEIFEERLEQYLLANRIEEDRKVSVLLTLISENVYKTLKHLCDPLKPKEKTFEQLIQLLSVQFKKRLSVYRRRIQFENLRQGPEPVNNWYVKIKNVASQCGFEGNMLEERVKDKFVVGMKSGPVQDRLCEEDTKKALKDLLEIALNKEAALQEASRGIEVNKMQRYGQGQGSQNKDRKVMGNKKEAKGERTEENKKSETELKCNYCGKGNHNFKFCKYKKFTCKKCKKIGHIAAACKVEKNFYLDSESGNAEKVQELPMFQIQTLNYVEPFKVNVLINKIPFDTELDTGAGVSCIPFLLFKQKLPNVEIEPCFLKLKTYSGEVVLPEGQVKVDLQIQGKSKRSTFILVKNASKILLGRDLINDFKLSFKSSKVSVNDLVSADKVTNLVSRFDNLFKNELGTYTGEKITLEVQDNVKPIFQKPRPIPFAFREKVVAELSRLESDGVIKKVCNSIWGTPILPVMKANGRDVRVCANYKITINKHLKDFNHPLPRIEEIFAALQGGQKFTKLDFLNAYNQLVLDEKTSELLSWSTPFGIYKVFRLPYGTKPACSIFQQIVERVLQGCKGTVNFLDDVVVTGKDEAEHLQNLEEVLTRLDRAGFKLNIKKCEFFKDCIYYLGHKISERGLERDHSKVKAILDSPQPRNMTEVRAFCGMINYYSKFIPNLSGNLRPLYNLVGKDKEFKWDKPCRDAFEWAKRQMISEKVLVHFDPNKPVRLACDSSQYGIGGVLMHVMSDGSERPICYISRVLSKAEKNYSMIMKEALAIYWAVTKLYQYLAGRKFEILCDHKPLQALFGEHRSLPQMAAGRIQRWSLFLSNFDYTFKYIKGTDNTKADALSRLPLQEICEDSELNFDYLNFIENSIVVDSYKVRSETRKDPILGTVFNFIRYGFPAQSNNALLRPFLSRQHELSIDRGIIMWGYRVLIPASLRKDLLYELHSTHEGIVKMKSKARSYFWWPSLDAEIEDTVNSCKVCMAFKPEPNKAKLIPTSSASYFYERVHADFLGPLNGKMILILIDSFSKWPEAFVMKSTDSKSTIEIFRECFARFGLPKIVVTDNGPQFSAVEFSKFLSQNGIKHLTSPPFHPATNGLAENTVKSVKSGLKKALFDSRNREVSFETLLNRYLFNYRNSIHATTGFTPSSLVFKQKVRTRLDLLSGYQNEFNNKQVENYRGKREENFVVGDRVWIRDYRNPNKKGWVEGVIDEVLGERIYFCKVLNEEIIWKRHVNQILRNKTNVVEENSDSSRELGERSLPPNLPLIVDRAETAKTFVSQQLKESEDFKSVAVEPDLRVDLSQGASSPSPVTVEDESTSPRSSGTSSRSSDVSLNVNCRPKRNIKPPQRLNL